MNTSVPRGNSGKTPWSFMVSPAARFAERDEPQLHDPDFAAIAQRYRPYLPTLTGLSSTKFFEQGAAPTGIFL